MTRPRPRIGSELLPLFLILLCLGGTFALVLTMHRRGAASRRAAEAPKVAAITPPPPAPEPAADPEPPAPPPPPPAPVEDPTQKALAQLSAAESTERAETEKADRRAESLEAAKQAALAKSERWRRRESLVRAQIEDLSDRARRIQTELDGVAMERDALARERDVAKAALAKARTSSSYAILPHKGPNGTWRRPIAVECRNGMAILQPGGAAFGMLELSALGGLRSSPFVRAVARELVRIGMQSGPDGAANVPYIFFVIRPDGIRPYYEARGRLEALGIAFGYELVDQDWEIDFSELENPTNNDLLAPGRTSSSPPAVAEREELNWPGERPGAKRSGNEPSDAFVWHSRPGEAPAGSRDRRGDGEGRKPLGSLSGAPGGRALAGGADLAPLERPRAGGRGLGGGEVPGGGPGSRTSIEGGDGSDSDGSPGPADSASAAPHAGTSHDPAGAPFGMSGGQSATERAFGAPSRPSPMGRGGLPALEPVDGSDETVRGGSGGRSVAPNDGQAPFSGLPRGRAGVGVKPPQSALENLPYGEDEPPDDGRVPVMPRGYFDRDDEDDAPAGKSGASGGSGTGSGARGTSEASASSPGTSSQPSGASSGTPNPGAVNSPSGSAPSAGASASASRRGSATADKPPLRIEVPFEITVVCSRNGVIIHPGGYRLSPNSLKSKDQMLIKELDGVLQKRREVDPLIVPQPRLKFLMEAGGAQSYEDARKQTAVAGVAWPTTIQIGETKVMSFSGQETRR